jgi:hypothetical protein
MSLAIERAVTDFKAVFGPGDRYAEYTAATAKRLGTRIPEVMHALLEQDGFCSYKEQVLWLCDPDEWTAAAAVWFPESPSATVVARGPFGDLFVLDGESFYEVLVHESVVIPNVDDANWFFGFSMTQKGFATQALWPKKAHAAAKSVGALSADEMYTYVPALQMGGTFEDSKIERVKAHEQLVILSQLSEIRRR